MENIRLFECFAGIGSQIEALKRLSKDFKDFKFTSVGYSEIDKFAVKSYELIHGEDIKNYGDITKIDPINLPDMDLLTSSYPCFSGETFVITKEGYKQIKDIKHGDLVLTHDRNFKKVVKIMSKLKLGYYKLNVQGSPITKVTGNHPYYIRTVKKVWNNKIRRYERIFSKPYWKEVRYLDKDDYIGFTYSKYSNNQFKLDSEDCYILGRYVADGYIGSKKKYPYIRLCIGKKKVKNFENKLNKYPVKKNEERTTFKYRVHDKKLTALCMLCGQGAVNKNIPSFILDLPSCLLASFLSGYMDGDGCYTNNRYKASSISKILIYQIGYIIFKVYRVPFSIYYNKRKPKTIIEGRLVNQKSSWNITFSKEIKKQNNAIVIDDYLWSPFKGKVYYDEKINIYNLEVSDDNSYIANNNIVHNCTDISVAGKQRGFSKDSGTRSSLLWYSMNIIEFKKPKYVLFENVKALVSKKFKKDFDKWLQELNSLRYNVYWKVLNARDYGIPQNRERVFVVCIRKDVDDLKFSFPKKIQLKLKLQDVIEYDTAPNDVSYCLDANYYKGGNLKQFEEKKRRQIIITDTEASKKFQSPMLNMSPCLKASRCDYEVKIIDDKFKNKREVREYTDYSPCLDSMTGGNRQPKVKIEHEQIRKLTTKECFRLMGFTDQDHDKLSEISNTQKYKQAGNSIVVDVLYYLFKSLFVDKGSKKYLF